MPEDLSSSDGNPRPCHLKEVLRTYSVQGAPRGVAYGLIVFYLHYVLDVSLVQLLLCFLPCTLREKRQKSEVPY